ncbi:hypothetical protein [uncultured Luteimonas sp.]|uniref:hypothetical protein n=1 Tax=uncultured Luteimonas sp. TaxID=453144 RepID=UPI00260EE76E|nr:hypothetical protein [uncultured Luteimonas sp.]
MTQTTSTRPEAGADVQPPAGRVAFERLRERTDEIELIISGLLAFALLTVPGRAFDAWAASEVHVEGVFMQAVWFGFFVVTGLGYTLGTAFAVHLAIRGYWVGLIGLKSHFPDGIRWDRVPLMGSVSREHHERVVGDLGSAIDRADRAASILFAMTLLIALAIAWVGVLAVVAILAAGLVGRLFDDPARATTALLAVAYAVFITVGLVPVVLEKRIARLRRAGRDAPRLERTVRLMLRVLGVLIPQRLIAPVQLTLHSNLRGNAFMAVYMVVIAATGMLGSLQIAASSRLALAHHYEVVTTDAVDQGLRSAHYEALRSGDDVLKRLPMIPSDRIADSHLRLFIPHQPALDNPLARERCAEGGRNRDGEGAGARAVACIARLWSVTLDGEPVSLAGFLPAERRDLGLRGIVGYLDMAALAHGRHDLHLVWNADGGDRGVRRRREYTIPFWLSPGLEQASGTR